MRLFNTKDFIHEPLDIDTPTRRVKIAIAAFDNVDRGKEVLMMGAADRTIRERGPQGTNEIWHMADHDYTLMKALSKFSELGVDNGKLYGVSNIAKTSFGNDILEHYANKAINQHSIGYGTVESVDLGNGVLGLKQIALWEGSSVLWGMNPDTPTLDYGKSIDAKLVIDRLDILLKCWANGKYTDEFFSLIKMQILSIKQYVSDLETKANVTAQEAKHTAINNDEEQLKSALQSILKKHNSL